MTLAQNIVTRANAIAQERADNESAYDWSNYESFTRYVAVVRSAIFWVVSENRVAGNVEPSRDAEIWGYVVSEILDSAASEFALPDSALIESHHVSASLSW